MFQNDSGPTCKSWLTLNLLLNHKCCKNYLENLQDVLYTKRLTALFCFYQRGFFILLEHQLEDWK